MEIREVRNLVRSSNDFYWTWTRRDPGRAERRGAKPTLWRSREGEGGRCTGSRDRLQPLPRTAAVTMTTILDRRVYDGTPLIGNGLLKSSLTVRINFGLVGADDAAGGLRLLGIKITLIFLMWRKYFRFILAFTYKYSFVRFKIPDSSQLLAKFFPIFVALVTMILGEDFLMLIKL